MRCPCRWWHESLTQLTTRCLHRLVYTTNMGSHAHKHMHNLAFSLSSTGMLTSANVTQSEQVECSMKEEKQQFMVQNTHGTTQHRPLYLRLLLSSLNTDPAVRVQVCVCVCRFSDVIAFLSKQL